MNDLARNSLIKKILEDFCRLMFEKEEHIQSVKVVVEMKDKSKVKFKKFVQK